MPSPIHCVTRRFFILLPRPSVTDFTTVGHIAICDGLWMLLGGWAYSYIYPYTRNTRTIPKISKFHFNSNALGKGHGHIVKVAELNSVICPMECALRGNGKSETAVFKTLAFLKYLMGRFLDVVGRIFTGLDTYLV